MGTWGEGNISVQASEDGRTRGDGQSTEGQVPSPQSPVLAIMILLASCARAPSVVSGAGLCLSDGVLGDMLPR